MAITKQKKEALLEQYKQDLEKSSAIFLTQYQGLSVNQLTELRHKLREANSGYVVIKNTLAKRALSDMGLNSKGVEALLEGPVGVSFCFGDPPPVAKALVDFAGDQEVFAIKGGLLGEVFLTGDAVESLAKLPPLDVLQARLLGVIAAPASQLAGVLASGMRQVVNVIDAYSKKEEDNGHNKPATGLTESTNLRVN